MSEATTWNSPPTDQSVDYSGCRLDKKEGLPFLGFCLSFWFSRIIVCFVAFASTLLPSMLQPLPLLLHQLLEPLRHRPAEALWPAVAPQAAKAARRKERLRAPLASWLAWPAGWLASPGLACPPAPPPLQTPQPAQPAYRNWVADLTGRRRRQRPKRQRPRPTTAGCGVPQPAPATGAVCDPIPSLPVAPVVSFKGIVIIDMFF